MSGVYYSPMVDTLIRAEDKIAELTKELVELQKKLEESKQLNLDLAETLRDVVSQNCSSGDELDSFAISANAEAIRLLAQLGHLEITKEYGRRVIGKWKNA